MLSYRHAFHAGNHADVLKHLVLIQCLEHMTQKETSLMYIDTHAGAGTYGLKSDMATQHAEFNDGVKALDFSQLPDFVATYATALKPYLTQHVYPGSPRLTADLLRKQDKLRLFELHPADSRLLQSKFTKDKRVIVQQSNGYDGLKAMLPAPQKRALVLIDPSYEVKTEYRDVITAIKEGYKRMATACFLLWYPVVNRAAVRRLGKELQASGIKNVMQYELCIEADSDQFGMTGSGMIVINPPWKLTDQMKTLLPALQQQLAPNGHYSIDTICSE